MTTALAKTYETGPDGAWIRCLVCKLTSHNPHDVSERYCGKCHIFHDDPPVANPAKCP